MTVQEAEKQIAQILAQLERETDMVVKDIGLSSIDMTSLGSPCRQLQQCVVIQMERMPGNNWAV